MFMTPQHFICPIGPYPNCPSCRHFLQCPYFAFPLGFPFSPAIFMPPAPYPHDQFCSQCGHTLTQIAQMEKWYCSRCRK